MTKAPALRLVVEAVIGCQNIENITEHRLVGLTVDNKFRSLLK